MKRRYNKKSDINLRINKAAYKNRYDTLLEENIKLNNKLNMRENLLAVATIVSAICTVVTVYLSYSTIINSNKEEIYMDIFKFEQDENVKLYSDHVYIPYKLSYIITNNSEKSISIVSATLTTELKTGYWIHNELSVDNYEEDKKPYRTLAPGESYIFEFRIAYSLGGYEFMDLLRKNGWHDMQIVPYKELVQLMSENNGVFANKINQPKHKLIIETSKNNVFTRVIDTNYIHIPFAR